MQIAHKWQKCAIKFYIYGTRARVCLPGCKCVPMKRKQTHKVHNTIKSVQFAQI